MIKKIITLILTIVTFGCTYVTEYKEENLGGASNEIIKEEPEIIKEVKEPEIIETPEIIEEEPIVVEEPIQIIEEPEIEEPVEPEPIDWTINLDEELTYRYQAGFTDDLVWLEFHPKKSCIIYPFHINLDNSKDVYALTQPGEKYIRLHDDHNIESDYQKDGFSIYAPYSTYNLLPGDRFLVNITKEIFIFSAKNNCDEFKKAQNEDITNPNLLKVLGATDVYSINFQNRYMVDYIGKYPSGSNRYYYKYQKELTIKTYDNIDSFSFIIIGKNNICQGLTIPNYNTSLIKVCEKDSQTKY